MWKAHDKDPQASTRKNVTTFLTIYKDTSCFWEGKLFRLTIFRCATCMGIYWEGGPGMAVAGIWKSSLVRWWFTVSGWIVCREGSAAPDIRDSVERKLRLCTWINQAQLCYTSWVFQFFSRWFCVCCWHPFLYTVCRWIILWANSDAIYLQLAAEGLCFILP